LTALEHPDSNKVEVIPEWISSVSGLSFIVAFVTCSWTLLFWLSPCPVFHSPLPSSLGYGVFSDCLPPCLVAFYSTSLLPSSLQSSSLYMVLGPSACMASIKRLSNCSLLSSLPLPLHQRLPVLHSRLPWTATTISVHIKHQQPTRLMYVHHHLLLGVED
jgi:hypothetical protein